MLKIKKKLQHHNFKYTIISNKYFKLVKGINKHNAELQRADPGTKVMV